MKILTVGSSTRTMRAQEILRGNGIITRIKRLDSSGEGCARGLLTEDGQVSRAVELLRQNGIPVTVRTEAGI